ncbi:shikimate dehydrogenase [Suttonella ornithocola]|uniref:Shikimate dehydrogenase (NADP(+)) n=1 Tax=Suttonella ornithocola TaxID=279832 RepID=A0A380MTB9_9GAMM|nr:shikimate dehydrogenase [Suttonella ornithocola]SUO95859.1 Shikimate dehydrogenase [Suttonella ornithocola]
MSYRCAVIGNPIAHSRSPEIHTRFAEEAGIKLQYDKILSTEESFTDTVQNFFDNGGCGLNITVPFKEHAYRLCDDLTPYARLAGAVNTLWMDNGALCGDNTDGRGLVRALTHIHHISLRQKRILLIGAGGAARGVILPLLDAEIARLDIINRTLNKAETLVHAHTELSDIPMHAYALDAPLSTTYDIIINATSTGLSDTTFVLDSTAVQVETVCYDMVYGKTTPFMHWATENGAVKIFDGYSMLESQARLSFEIWFADELASL